MTSITWVPADKFRPARLEKLRDDELLAMAFPSSVKVTKPGGVLPIGEDSTVVAIMLATCDLGSLVLFSTSDSVDFALETTSEDEVSLGAVVALPEKFAVIE